MSVVLLGVVEYAEGKRLKSALADRGVQLELKSNPETCTTGCKPTVEIHIREEDVAVVRAFMEQEKARSLDGLEFDASLANEVFDPEKETARCPACGTEFSTKLTECPDCGLGFSGG